MILKSFVPEIIILALLVVVMIALIFCLIRKKYRQPRLIRRCLILLVLIGILARPAIYTQDVIEQANSKDVIFFVADMSGSMVAKDCDYNKTRRYKKVNQDIKTIAAKFAGASYSIIAADYGNYTALPVSDNLDNLRVVTDSLIPKDSNKSADTDLVSLIRYADEHIAKYQLHHSDSKFHLFFFSDGGEKELTENIGYKINSKLESGAVFGYGSNIGASLNMIFLGKIEENYYIKENGREVVSKINETNLQNIAKALGATYYKRQNDSLTENTLTELSIQDADFVNKNQENYLDLYWVFALILATLLIWELLYLLNQILLEKQWRQDD